MSLRALAIRFDCLSFRRSWCGPANALPSSNARWPAASGAGFFQGCLAAYRGVTPAERRSWRDGVFAQIQAMTGPQGLGSATRISVERLCRLAEVSRASFYRHWHETAAGSEETALRDVMQRLCLAHRHYGYRRIGALLRRDGWQMNHKRVLRLMREDTCAERPRRAVQSEHCASLKIRGIRRSGDDVVLRKRLLVAACLASLTAESTASAVPVAKMIPVEKNVQLDVLDWGGSGAPLIFLSGFGGTAHTFEGLAEKFTGSHHVHAITRRGFGRSSHPQPTLSAYSPERLGADIAAVIEALHIDRPFLAGHSLAGQELSEVGTPSSDSGKRPYLSRCSKR